MSAATVYKTLALLKDMDQVFEIDLRVTATTMATGRPPSHLFCTECGKIVDGDLELDRSTIRKLEKASGYRIVRPQLAFYGHCPIAGQGVNEPLIRCPLRTAMTSESVFAAGVAQPDIGSLWHQRSNQLVHASTISRRMNPMTTTRSSPPLPAHRFRTIRTP